MWKAVLKLDPDHADARVGLRKGQRFDHHDALTMITTMIMMKMVMVILMIPLVCKGGPQKRAEV